MFYISSQGHSATGWLAKSLSMHPDIVCWHGTRGIPPYESGLKDISIEDFVEGLVQCEIGCFGEKVFGACHGFYGIQAKQLTENHGGVFLSVVRHPVMRINSIFNAFAGPELSYGFLPTDTKMDVNQLIRENIGFIDNKLPILFEREKKKTDKAKILRSNLTNSKVLQLIKKTRIHMIYRGAEKLLTDFQHTRKREMIRRKAVGKYKLKDIVDTDTIVEGISRNFITACNRTFLSDSEIFDACDYESQIKMEEVIISESYFLKVVSKLVESNTNDNFIREVFSNQDHMNYHSNPNARDPIDVFNAWPESFKGVFFAFLESTGSRSSYESLGYNIPR